MNIAVAASYDADARALDLTLTQTTAPTPGQPDKKPLPTPILIGLVWTTTGGAQTYFSTGGSTQALEQLVVLEGAEATVRLEGVERPPVLSALRGFSAPVRLTTDAPAKDRYTLLAADPDPVQPLGGRAGFGPRPDPGPRRRAP